jgi:hypothetical protein
MSESQKNIDFIQKSTAIYHTRAERTVYLAAVVSKNFVISDAVARVIHEFITGDKFLKNFVNPEASGVAEFALYCQNIRVSAVMLKLKMEACRNSSFTKNKS